MGVFGGTIDDTGRVEAAKIETFSEVEEVDSAPRGMSASWAGVSVERFQVPPSEHPDVYYEWHQIFLPLKGTFAQGHRSASGFRRDTAAVGDASVVPAYTPHRGLSETDGEFASVFVDPLLLARASDVDGEASVELAPQFAAKDPVVRQIAGLLVGEAASETRTGGLYTESLAVALAAHLARSYPADKPSSSTEQRLAGLPPSSLRRVLDYVGDNLVKDFRLEDLAKEANLSPYHFARLFKASTGFSPHQYVIRERVECAKGLLLAGLSVGEVARLVGFADQSHLGRHFRRLLGTTPKDYRL